MIGLNALEPAHLRQPLLCCLATICLSIFSAGQQYKVLHVFTGQPDGGTPFGGLVRDTAGNLYGTTSIGGTSGSGANGTIYKIDPSGNETILHNFIKPEGINSYSGLVLDKGGSLYGTNSVGGVRYGTVFKLYPGGKLQLLHRFESGLAADGTNPYSGVTMDAQGNLYGTTTYGGGGLDNGAVYKIDTTGTYTLLYSFGAQPDGRWPYGVPIADSAGNLYGTTVGGGPFATTEQSSSWTPAATKRSCTTSPAGLQTGNFRSVA
jgi:uncharacterized repeat protein (TIGR03803 family)